MRIVFAIDCIMRKAGGAERSLIEIANEMDARGHEVRILTNDPDGNVPNTKPFFEVAPSITIQNIHPGRKPLRTEPIHYFLRFMRRGICRLGRYTCGFLAIALKPIGLADHASHWAWRIANGPTIRRWRCALNAAAPDRVLAFLPIPAIQIATALRKSGVPLAIAIRNAPQADHQALVSLEPLASASMIKAAKMAQQVFLLLESYRDFYPHHLQSKLRVIPNVIHSVPPEFRARPHADKPRAVILNVGRLTPQKNQQLLVRSFAPLAASYPNWIVKIVGEGELRTDLENLIVELGLQSRVFLPGLSSEITQEMREASIFAFPSLWEGFSRAHSEAMAHGLPSAALYECHYAHEIISASGGGILTENNVADFSAALEHLMSSPVLRQACSDFAIAYASQYQPRIIMDRWESALTSEPVPAQSNQGTEES